MIEFEPKLDQWIDYGHTLGLEYMICSSAGGMHRDPSRKGEMNLDDWRYVADEFNRVGEKIKAAGMTFGYHNHILEFGSENGVVFYDELLKRPIPSMWYSRWIAAGWLRPATIPWTI